MREISRRSFLRISAVAGAGAVLVACNPNQPANEAVEDADEFLEPGADDEFTGEEPADDEAEPEPIEDVPPEEQVLPRQDVPRERTFNYMFGGPEYAYVGIANPYARTHQDGAAAMMEGLFYYAALDDKTYPWLAEAYKYNEDATQITISLREGAAWADGEPFDANDVIFTLQFLKEWAPLLNYSAKVEDFVESAEALDDHTVLVTLNRTNFRFHFDFLTYRFDRGIYWLPEHIWAEQDFGEDPLEFAYWDPEQGWPVHTGPYVQTRFEAMVQFYDRRYEWWAEDIGLVDRMPYPERIVVVPHTGEETAAQSLLNSEIDTTLDFRPSTIRSIIARGGDYIKTYTGGEEPFGYVDWWPISMYFNTAVAPYDDPAVRWAMAYAINQETVVEIAWEGAGAVTNGPFPYFPRLERFLGGIDDILEEFNPLEHDLDRVEELMTGAGYIRNDEGFWVMPDGTPFDTDVYAPVPLFGDIAPITVELLRQAGFDARHVTPPDVWTAMDNGEALLHFFGHGGSVFDPWLTLDMYTSKYVAPVGKSAGPNRPRWSNEAYDEIVERMAVTPVDDEARIQELFNAAMAIWYEELPEVPLVQWFHRVAMNQTYWTNWPGAANPYNTAPWHLTFPITLWNLEPTA